VTGAKIVTGTATTNAAGNATVTLTGSATFTSGTSYVCTTSAEAPAASPTAPAISGKTATGFTIKGAGSTTYSFVCVGN
jgi:hypothetical protein